MPDSFPSETHPADDLDLDEIVSDFAFGRPCHIPPGIVGDATRLVFGTHWPALLRTVRAYRKRVDELEAALRRSDKRYDDVARQLGDRRRELMAARRDVEQARAERGHWVGRFYESVPQRFVVGADCPVDGCGGERVELHVAERADPVAVRLTCGHDEPRGSEPPKPVERATPHATPAKPSH